MPLSAKTKKSAVKKASKKITTKEVTKGVAAKTLHLTVPEVELLQAQGDLVLSKQGVERMRRRMARTALVLGCEDSALTSGALTLSWGLALDLADRLASLEEAVEELQRKRILTADLELIGPNGPERLLPFDAEVQP